MNFKGHFVGGIIVGTTVVSVAVISHVISLDNGDTSKFFREPLNFEGSIPVLAVLFVITLFMALFPDLDTASIPQRWFFRSMFIILAVLCFQGKMAVFAVLTFLTISPVLHKHRGWTHWKIVPWLLSLYLAVVFEFLRSRESWFSEFSWNNVNNFLATYWIYVFACVFGHYTHLVLDSKAIKIIPFISNSANHH